MPALVLPELGSAFPPLVPPPWGPDAVGQGPGCLPGLPSLLFWWMACREVLEDQPSQAPSPFLKRVAFTDPTALPPLPLGGRREL